MKPMALMLAILVVALPALALALLGAWSRRTPPSSTAARDGLVACPSSPNCVASNGGSGRRPLLPLRYAGPADAARRRLIAVLREFPRTRIVDDAGPYLHVEFRSALFGFIDDVEFLFDEQVGRIDFRSASRVGYSDFGANRRRMEEIRRRLASAGVPPS